ncbi:7108_t:CDS:1, partial [Gigaspora rosea]
ILDGLCPKIPINIPQELVKLMERCWHRDPKKRINNLKNELMYLILKAESGEIKFPENDDTNISPTKINDQAIYSSRPLTLLIKKALTLQSMKLNSNEIT